MTVDIAFNEDQLDILVLTLGEFLRQDDCPHCLSHAHDVLGLLQTARKGLQEAIDEDIRVNGEK